MGFRIIDFLFLYFNSSRDLINLIEGWELLIAAMLQMIRLSVIKKFIQELTKCSFRSSFQGIGIKMPWNN